MIGDSSLGASLSEVKGIVARKRAFLKQFPMVGNLSGGVFV